MVCACALWKNTYGFTADFTLINNYYYSPTADEVFVWNTVFNFFSNKMMTSRSWQIQSGSFLTIAPSPHLKTMHPGPIGMTREDFTIVEFGLSVASVFQIFGQFVKFIVHLLDEGEPMRSVGRIVMLLNLRNGLKCAATTFKRKKIKKMLCTMN